MATTGLVDGRMLGRLNRFFPSTVTIQSRATGSDTFGQPNGAWSDVAGLVNLACNVGLPRGGVRRMPPDVSLHEDQEIVLSSYQSTITTAMRAVVTGGLTYDIIAVFQDPLLKVTRLVVSKPSI